MISRIARSLTLLVAAMTLLVFRTDVFAANCTDFGGGFGSCWNDMGGNVWCINHEPIEWEWECDSYCQSDLDMWVVPNSAQCNTVGSDDILSCECSG